MEIIGISNSFLNDSYMSFIVYFIMLKSFCGCVCLCVRMCVCVCISKCVCMCVCGCVTVCRLVCACTFVRTCDFACAHALHINLACSIMTQRVSIKTVSMQCVFL